MEYFVCFFNLASVHPIGLALNCNFQETTITILKKKTAINTVRVQ